MENKKHLLEKLNTVQKNCIEKNYIKIRDYENIIRFVDIIAHHKNIDNCKTCSEILKELDEQVSIPYNKTKWKTMDIISIFNSYIINTHHLIKEHNYYRKKIYIVWASLALIPVDIILVILFIKNYIYLIFPISLVFYYLASYIENWYVNKYVKRFLNFSILLFSYILVGG